MKATILALKGSVLVSMTCLFILRILAAPPNHFINDTMFPGLDKPYSLTSNGHDFNAPYGVTWLLFTAILDAPHLLFGPFPILNGTRVYSFWIITLMINTVTLALLLRKGETIWLLIYFPISIIHWSLAPWNMIVLWSIMIGRKYPLIGLPLAVVTKLPFGGPIQAWSYALNMAQTYHRGFDSWEMYGSMVGLWLLVLMTREKILSFLEYAMDWMIGLSLLLMERCA